MSTKSVLEEIAKERNRQDEKWGEQNHSPATPSKMRSKIAQEILDEMEPKHSDLVREYGALWLENDQQAIQIKALKEQLQAAAESLRLHKELVEAVEAFLKREVKDGEMDTGAIILSDILTKIKSNN